MKPVFREYLDFPRFQGVKFSYFFPLALQIQEGTWSESILLALAKIDLSTFKSTYLMNHVEVRL
jgi:hypothetical protein